MDTAWPDPPQLEQAAFWWLLQRYRFTAGLTLEELVDWAEPHL
jgi:hypothetical protein